ncbi:hypothetical protein EXM22_12685 [Oceanispirochaeta crateris]|uniref:Thioredoxin family protein n=1 Tax=Oceanispirochaeta crateris TaxID=2518645 RepID=A0A5C1QL86_9SPIO|nr:hypothetical protein [Oceanispirochaeta crateris]QEN08803.1 hypothetical protein EXM22_12685 [Oceanispirochaeta crateris]
MIKLTELNDNESLKAMEHGDFSEEILNSAPYVIVIMTQSWCPDWIAQRSVLATMTGRDDLKVYYLEYDKKEYRSDFTYFKETNFSNSLIPYLRYYKNGKFEIDNNFGSRRRINNWLKA